MKNVCVPPHQCTQIAAIASRNLERAKDFAKKHGIPTAYGSYKELANNPDIGESYKQPGYTGRENSIKIVV